MEVVLPSPYYRVSAKLLVFDDVRRLLVFQDSKGKWEIPGGGWEHGESFEACLKRELMEEMRVVPTHIGPVSFVYRSQHENGNHKVCIAAVGELESHDFQPSSDDLVQARFVTQGEFERLQFQASEQGIQTCTDQIWPTH